MKTGKKVEVTVSDGGDEGRELYNWAKEKQDVIPSIKD